MVECGIKRRIRESARGFNVILDKGNRRAVSFASPHPSSQELAGYAAGQLPPVDVLRVSDHLAECTVCRAEAARIRKSGGARSSDPLAEPESLPATYEELAGEIDGTLDSAQRAILDAKLSASSSAREALADLAAFRDEMAGLPPKFHGPGRWPESGCDQPAEGKVILPPVPRWRVADARIAALAALVIILGVGAWIFARSGSTTPPLLRDAGGRPSDLSGLPAGLKDSVEAAARTGRLPPPDMPALARETEVLAGLAGDTAMRTVFPVGMVVRELRPTLRWTPNANAAAYAVHVASGSGRPLISSPPLPPMPTEWTLPEALARGETYEWQVDALSGAEVIDRAPKPPEGETRFRVLDAGHEAGLIRVESRAGDSPLIRGVAYWRAGLAEAAAEQFHRLVLAHPESAAARRLESEAYSPAPTTTNGAQ